MFHVNIGLEYGKYINCLSGRPYIFLAFWVLFEGLNMKTDRQVISLILSSFCQKCFHLFKLHDPLIIYVA